MPAEVSHHSTVDVGAEAETRDATCVIFLVPLGAVSVVLRAGEVLSVGRSSAADVCLDDASVSRVHARLSLIDGSVHVHDAGSRNGVWVNGQRVQRHTIGTQDRVRIGGVGLMVVESGDAAPQQAAFRAKQRDRRAAQVSPSSQGPLPARIISGTATKPIFELAQRAARADLPVLVVGETGVGKEVVARAFHDASLRGARPFRDVNCGAIPASLIATTFFGHEKGAFTGADARAAGVFEEAHGGTLFLDELGELSPDGQCALLRVLEQKRVTRVGSTRAIDVDVRVIAATNRPLQQYVADGRFRADLLYRLEGLHVFVPPLRERRDEIPALAQSFLEAAARRWKAPAQGIAPDALDELVRADWPGNARQLRNVVERAVALSSRAQLARDDVSIDNTFGEPPTGSARIGSTLGLSLPEAVRNYEVAAIRAALKAAEGNRSRAARELGVPRRTLGTKLKEYGID